MPSYIPYPTLQDADTRSAEYWTAHLGRAKHAEDVTEYLYPRVVRSDDPDAEPLPDGVDVAIVVHDRDDALDGLVIAETLTETEATAVATLYPPWQPDTDYTDDIVEDGGKLWLCRVPHRSQATWQPGVAHSLWRIAHVGGIVPEWVQPTGEHNSYPMDMVVLFEDAQWRSNVDGNVWEPGTGELWTLLGDDGQPVEPVPEQPAAWVQPTGAHDAYNTGDRVTHNGQVWQSTIDGNVWPPNVHGWVLVQP